MFILCLQCFFFLRLQPPLEQSQYWAELEKVKKLSGTVLLALGIGWESGLIGVRCAVDGLVADMPGLSQQRSRQLRAPLVEFLKNIQNQL